VAYKPRCKGIRFRRIGLHNCKALEKVLDRLAVTDKATLVLERAPEGKILVTSSSWDWEKVFLRDQVLEVGNVEG
jgi:hypothetical protein